MNSPRRLSRQYSTLEHWIQENHPHRTLENFHGAILRRYGYSNGETQKKFFVDIALKLSPEDIHKLIGNQVIVKPTPIRPPQQHRNTSTKRNVLCRVPLFW